MRTSIAILLTLSLAACATGKGPNTTPTDKGPGTRITLDVEIDTKGVPIGAYQIVVVHDAAEAKIVAVGPARDANFAGTPNFDPGTFDSGATRITGYQLRAAPAKGPVKLASVVFQRLGAPRSPVNVKVERLYDVSNPPKEITRFDVVTSRTALDFGVPD